jgi:hypothetical protein
MTQWDETMPAFKIIRALADLRQASPAVWEGAYHGLFSDQDVLVFERQSGQDVVLVAVNRGDPRTVQLPVALPLGPGVYRGLLADTSDANAGGLLTVEADGAATLRLDHLGALVVRSGQAAPVQLPSSR